MVHWLYSILSLCEGTLSSIRLSGFFSGLQQMKCTLIPRWRHVIPASEDGIFQGEQQRKCTAKPPSACMEMAGRKPDNGVTAPLLRPDPPGFTPWWAVLASREQRLPRPSFTGQQAQWFAAFQKTTAVVTPLSHKTERRMQASHPPWLTGSPRIQSWRRGQLSGCRTHHLPTTLEKQQKWAKNPQFPQP